MAALPPLMTNAERIEISLAATSAIMAGRIALPLALACALLPSTAAAYWPVATSSPAPSTSKTSAGQWYYASNGRTEGPLDDVAVSAAYLAGRIGEHTMVRQDGEKAWVPLAESAGFAAIDRWYVRHRGRELGPMTGAELRSKLADVQAKGQAVDALEVRMELTFWVPLASALPMASPARTRPPATPTAVAPVPAPTPTHRGDLPAAAQADPPASGELDRANRLRKGGIITLGVGCGFVIIGGGIAGGYSTGAVGAKTMWGGVALAGVGVVPIIIGAAVLGAGNAKLRKAMTNERVASLRFGATASRDRAGVALRGRF